MTPNRSPSDTPTAFSPAAERNQAPILQVLLRVLPRQGRALEIASGTGQHAAHFAAALPDWEWQPTDQTPGGFPAILEWARHTGAHNVRTPLPLNVLDEPWPLTAPPDGEAWDLVYCANMLHIAPWSCCEALVRGAAQHLAPQGQLVTYGPYLEDGVPTAPGNQHFDAQLRAQNAQWGIRCLHDVARVAAQAGLELAQRHAMPANNLLLVWRRTPGAVPRPDAPVHPTA